MRHTLLFVICIGLFLQSKGQGTLPKERSAEIVRKIVREKLRPGFLEDPEVRKHLPVSMQAELQQVTRTANITEVVVSGGSEAESEVHAVRHPSDTTKLIVSSNSVDPNGSGATDVPVNHIYYSHDFGTSWQRSAFDPLPVTSGVTIAGGGDPNFCYDMNGRVYTSWINLYLQGFTSVTWDLLWAYSDDDGVTWQRGTTPAIISTTGPITALFDPTQFNGPIADKEWLAVDRGFSPYANSVYCVYYEAGGPANLNAIAVRHLRPGAGSFSSSTYVTDNSFVFVQFGSIDVAANGRVHVSFFGSTDNVNYGVYHSFSDDGGLTFNTPQLVSEAQVPNFSSGQSGQTIAGINVDRMYPCVYMAVDKSYMQTFSGNTYLVWSANGVNTQGATGMDIYFSKSTDDGQTWSPAIVLNNTAPGDVSDQFYPNLAVSYGGIVAVSWYDRRNHPGTADTDYYMAWSLDGGNSFNNDIPVSGAPSDFNTIGSVNQDFGIGEYNGLVVTENYGIPVWGDGRTNDGELDLVAALVPFRFNTGLPAHTGSITSLSLAPNPAGTATRLKVNLLSAGTYRLQIVDARGRICATSTLQLAAGGSMIPIETHQLANGRYTILLRNDKGLSQAELIVNH